MTNERATVLTWPAWHIQKYKIQYRINLPKHLFTTPYEKEKNRPQHMLQLETWETFFHIMFVGIHILAVFLIDLLI